MKGSLALSIMQRSLLSGLRTLHCRRCVLSNSRNRPNLLLPACASAPSVSPLSCSSTSLSQQTATKTGLWSKIKFDLGFISGLKYPKAVLNLSGFRMYVCCTEMIDTPLFFSEFDLPDTFNSWFLVTNLHVWLCMVRLGSLGKDGRLLRNCLAKAMWEDVQARSKQLGSAASLTSRREGVSQMADEFRASLFAYDEGLLGDDKDLAGAVWRIFFQMRPDVEASQLELMVAYIRKQVAHIDQQNEETVLGRGFVSFLPLRGETLDAEAAQRQAATAGHLRTKF